MRANKRPDTHFLGPLAYLQLRPALRPIWLGSAWAALCGAVASGGLSFTGEGLLFLLLILFLADPLLGALRALIVITDWFSPLIEGRASSVRVVLSRPPYTMEGSVSHRAFAWLEEALTWWRGLFWPKSGTSLLSLIMALVLALVLAAILGQEVLLLVIIALALAAMEVLFSGAAQLFLRACSAVGVPWLVGHLGLEPLSWPSFLLAFMYTAAYCACLSLEKDGSRSAIAFLNAAQVSVIILLVVLQRPILAGVLGLLLLPQLLLQPLTNRLRRQGVGLWYLQRTQFFLMAGMIAAAGAVMGF